MRNLVLILIAFIAVVTFIRAFDNASSADLRRIPETMMEFDTKK
jgi:hypothetical protein